MKLSREKIEKQLGIAKLDFDMQQNCWKRTTLTEPIPKPCGFSKTR